MLTRRQWLAGVAATTALTALPSRPLSAAGVIPSTGETLPSVGLGSWITFDARNDADTRRSVAVIDAFMAASGGMIDSSPMYGMAQQTIGVALAGLAADQNLFSATKVWIPGADSGQAQMEQALNLWGLERFDLIHVHNMVDWEAHLPWLQEWKAEGRLRYTGISTSHGRRHEAMARVIRTQPFDFVQFTYNIHDREAERTLLPLALDHGKAVVINRPFQGGGLFRRVRNRPLPDWAPDIGCSSWAQFFLKFILSHPAVTCPIPATTRVDHLVENQGSMTGPMPDADQRRAMAEWYDRTVR